MYLLSSDVLLCCLPTPTKKKSFPLFIILPKTPGALPGVMEVGRKGAEGEANPSRHMCRVLSTGR